VTERAILDYGVNNARTPDIGDWCAYLAEDGKNYLVVAYYNDVESDDVRQHDAHLLFMLRHKDVSKYIKLEDAQDETSVPRTFVVTHPLTGKPGTVVTNDPNFNK
jgi:hypothetical protein